MDEPRTSTVGTLLEHMLTRCGPIILRNAHGIMELRGDDLYLRRGKTLTVYHRAPERGESRSHAHLYVSGLTWAEVVQPEGLTPRLDFWPDRSHRPTAKAPLSVYFPRFYSWGPREPLPENQAYFRDWVGRHGGCFVLTDDAPKERSARADAGFPGSHRVGDVS